MMINSIFTPTKTIICSCVLIAGSVYRYFNCDDLWCGWWHPDSIALQIAYTCLLYTCGFVVGCISIRMIYPPSRKFKTLPENLTTNAFDPFHLYNTPRSRKRPKKEE